MTQTQRNWWEIDESKPYGFISYAHHDRKKVDPIAYQLIRDGYPVWMDHDIVSGADWSEYIADHLKNASYAVIFLSEASIRSGNVRDEINFARNEGKPLIVVYLEDVSERMPKGLHLSLDRFQAVDAYSHSFAETVRELEGAVAFRKKRKQQAAAAREERQNQPRKHRQQAAGKRRKKNSRRAGILAAVMVLLAAALILAVLTFRRMSQHQTAQPEADLEATSDPQTSGEATAAPTQNTRQNTQKAVPTPAAETTDYTFSSAVLSSRFNMTADDFQNFVAGQGADVSGLHTDNGNVVLSVTDDQKNSLLSALENNAASAASQPGGDITAASYENGYAGVDLTVSGTEVSSDDQSAADSLKAYGILIQALNDSSASFKVTFSDADGNLLSTESY